jgi:hypothetical protein
VVSGSFPFRYQMAGNGLPGGRTQEASDVPAEIARPFAELRWMGALPGMSRAKRRWRNQRISLTSGKRESPGVKRSQRCISHRVSAGPMRGRTRFRAGVLGEGFDSCVDINQRRATHRRRSPIRRLQKQYSASPSGKSVRMKRDDGSPRSPSVTT